MKKLTGKINIKVNFLNNSLSLCALAAGIHLCLLSEEKILATKARRHKGNSNIFGKIVSFINRFKSYSKFHFHMPLVVFILLMPLTTCSKNSSSLIILKNDKIEVGILPEVGGRIVLLRKPGLKNILKSNERLWENAEKQKPEISVFSDFKASNGHITWVGPQKEWWVHQTLNKERKKAKADWPRPVFNLRQK